MHRPSPRRSRTGNNAAPLSDSSVAKPAWLLNNRAGRRIFAGMRQMLLSFAFGLGLGLAPMLAAPALAAPCYADYKAKQDNPLRLHYGVIELAGPCRMAEARAEVAARLQRAGWTLLNLLGLFGPEGLEERKPDAGAYYLRF